MRDKLVREMLEVMAEKLGLTLYWESEEVSFYSCDDGILQQLKDAINEKENKKGRKEELNFGPTMKDVIEFAESYAQMEKYPLSGLAFYACKTRGEELKTKLQDICKAIPVKKRGKK